MQKLKIEIQTKFKGSSGKAMGHSNIAVSYLSGSKNDDVFSNGVSIVQVEDEEHIVKESPYSCSNTRNSSMPENITSASSNRSKRVLCLLGFLQIVLGLVLLFLWVDQEDKEDTKPSKLFGIVTAVSNLLSGCMSLAVGIGASDILAVLGKGSAVISCLCSVIALGIQSTKETTSNSDGSNADNPLLVIIPLTCLVMNILEIACYWMLVHHIPHYIIPDSRLGVFPVPEHVANPEGSTTNYGSVAAIDDESYSYQRQCQRPPAYSDPPAYVFDK